MRVRQSRFRQKMKRSAGSSRKKELKPFRFCGKIKKMCNTAGGCLQNLSRGESKEKERKTKT